MKHFWTHPVSKASYLCLLYLLLHRKRGLGLSTSRRDSACRVFCTLFFSPRTNYFFITYFHRPIVEVHQSRKQSICYNYIVLGFVCPIFSTWHFWNFVFLLAHNTCPQTAVKNSVYCDILENVWFQFGLTCFHRETDKNTYKQFYRYSWK